MSLKAIITRIAGFLLACSLLGLTACNISQTALDVIKDMKSALEDSTTVQMDIHMNLNLNYAEDDTEVSKISDLSLETVLLRDILSEQQNIQINKSLSIDKETETWESEYITYNEDDYQIHVQRLEDNWVFADESVETELVQIPFVQTLISLQDSYSLEKEDTINGKSCYVLQTALVPEDLNQLFSELRTLVSDETETSWDGLFAKVDSYSMQDIRGSLVIYVNEENNLPISVEVKMERWESLYSETDDSETESESDEDQSLRFSNASVNTVSMMIDFSFEENAEMLLPDEIISQEEFNERNEQDNIEEENQENIKTWIDYSNALEMLLNDQGIRVYLKKIYSDESSDSLCVSLVFLNSSDKDIEIYTEAAAVNHYMVEDYSPLYLTISSGERSEADFVIEEYSKRGFQSVDSIDIQIRADQSEDYLVLFSGQVLECMIRDSENEDSMILEEMELVLNQEDIHIWTGVPEEDSTQVRIPVVIENSSDTGYSIGVQSVVDEDGTVLDASLNGSIMSGNRLVTNMIINKSILAQSFDSLSEYVNVIVRATDLEELVTCFVTDPFAVYTGGEPTNSILPDRLRPDEEETETPSSEAEETVVEPIKKNEQ